MAEIGTQTGRLGPFGRQGGVRSSVAVGLGFLFMALSALVPDARLSLALLMSGASLACVVAVQGWLQRRQGLPLSDQAPDLHSLMEDDPLPALIGGPEGEVLYANAGAHQLAREGGAEEAPLPQTVEALLARRIEAPGAVIRRLRAVVGRGGAASEDLVTRSGHLRLSVQALEREQLLWRLEELDPPEPELPEDLPVLSVGQGDAILYMNAAARALAGGRLRRLDEMIVGGPEGPEARVLLRTATGTEPRLLREALRAGGRREIRLLPLPEEAPAPAETAIWSMVDALPLPILRLSSSGAIELANEAACQLLDIPRHPQLSLGELMEGLGRSIPQWLAEAATLGADGSSKPHSEFLRLSRSELEVFVQVAVKPVTHQGRVALIAVLSDATELKTLEAQFVQSQKMQAIGQLAGGVAHDFNNLLTAITGHCDLLLLRHDQGDPDFSDLMQINQNANRAASLVGQLLAFSRKQTLRPERLDLRDTLSDLTHLLNRLVGEKVTLSLSHDPVLPPIRADKRQLEQVLMNLVVNARDAMPEGGEIRITTEVLELEEEMHRDRAVVAPGRYVSVRVDDTGCGIPPDKLPKVFEPFFTTKRVGEGTGLGLSTAYGIVKQSGGFIFVDSTPGEGTSFTLLFPAREAREVVEAEILPPRLEELAPSRDGVILLVEDEAPVRAFASRALRLRGYSVLEAENAEQALETLKSTSRKIDVFVTDVIMPGMDGPSWVREALKSHPETRVVFVSGYAEDSFAESAARIPNSVFLPKPFSLAELTETVQAQMR